MPFHTAFWVIERPSSFRNANDSKWWRDHIQVDVIEKQKWEEMLTGSPLVKQPVTVALALEVLHLHSGGRLRDVDNTAKPIMDAFNGSLYDDDKQVRELIFRSLQYDSEAAHLAIQENEFFKIFLRAAVTHATRNSQKLEHLTFVVFREIDASLNSSATGVAAQGLLWNTVRSVFK